MQPSIYVHIHVHHDVMVRIAININDSVRDIELLKLGCYIIERMQGE